MTDKIPVDAIHHVTIVTRDARATALEHARFYGIPEWKVVRHTPERLKRTSIHGRTPSDKVPAAKLGHATPPGTFGFLSARGTSTTHGITVEIVQPTAGQSTFEHFLATRGQGIHSICLTKIGRSEIDGLRAFLAGNGVKLALSYAINDDVDFLYFDTRDQLGTYYLQVIVTDSDDWDATMPADETWDFAADLPSAPGAQPSRRIQGIGHFGVVIPDIDTYVERYAKLFGEPVWRLMHWRTEDWLLEDTTNNGVPVEHAFYSARANVGMSDKGVPIGFEVIQPLWGPSHYKEDFLEVKGPGIHHLDLAFKVTDWDEWDEFNAWVDKDFGAPNCMSGWLRGRVHLYQYQDTRRALGYVVEVHAPDPLEPPKPGSVEQFWLDFSEADAALA